MAQAMNQNERIDLPAATIDDQWTSEGDERHLVRIETEPDNIELSYIIGQFQDRGYEVSFIDFNRNTVTFAKEV